MPRCINCTRKYSSTMGFSCKYCDSEFCVACVSADIHSCICVGIRDSFAREQLSKKLIQGKMIISKVLKIS